MLYQVCTLTLQRIYSLMMGNDDKNEQQALHKLERKFERTFLIDLQKTEVKIPHQVFQLRLPPFANLEVKHQG